MYLFYTAKLFLPAKIKTNLFGCSSYELKRSLRTPSGVFIYLYCITKKHIMNKYEVTINLRLKAEDRKRLEQIATKTDSSVSRIARLAIKQYLQNQQTTAEQ